MLFLMESQSSDSLFLKVLATLNEAQARWSVAREAIRLGYGGVQAMHALTGLSRPTIRKGMQELRAGPELGRRERVRQVGGGRKCLEVADPELTVQLEGIMDETTAGDPMSLLKWTHKSTARIAAELTRQGHPISDETVRRRLKELGYSLPANRKGYEGGSPAARDAQFQYLNAQVQQFLARQAPVLSVDTKKKERVGEFKNPGRTWRPQGRPRVVNVYDFPSRGDGTAIPYGAYALQRNRGFVNVGMTPDTAEFAVESLRRWWKLLGGRSYAQASGLLLCADGGGSNGSRTRAWKFHLQQLTDELGLPITVCHYPPGTSKWNKIEHRLFSFISLNWQGQPLVSYETVVNLIGTTRTKTGLRVKAMLDPKLYPTGVKISDAAMAQLQVTPHEVHPQWNYTLHPRPPVHKK
jgi:Rhodopirellula transposase DDE domain